MTKLLPLLLLLAAATPAAAQDAPADPPARPFKVGGKFSGGTGGYRSKSGYAQYGAAWKLRAGFSSYDYDGSSVPVRTGTLRLSYQGEHLSFGVNGSATPLVEEYRSRGWGAELGWLFTPGDADADALIDEWDIGAWWAQTRHHQSIPATPALPVQRELIINQHDLGGSLSVTAGVVTLSVDGYTTLYDQDNFAAVVAASRVRPRLANAADLVNGFPSNGQSARLDVEAASWAVPYVSASRTDYELARQAVSTTVGGGVSFKYDRFGLDLGYEVSRQAGSPDAKYASAGASVRF